MTDRGGSSIYPVRQGPRKLASEIVAKHGKANDFAVWPSRLDVFANRRDAGIFSQIPAGDVMNKSNFRRTARHCSALRIVQASTGLSPVRRPIDTCYRNLFLMRRLPWGLALGRGPIQSGKRQRIGTP